jgi:hypothetical protein
MFAQRKGALLLGMLILAAANGKAARCDEWYLEPQLQTKMQANDNVDLDRNGGRNVIGATLSPQLRAGHRSDLLDLDFVGGADFNGYVVNRELSSIDEQLGFHGAYRMSELSTLSLDSGFKHDTILSNPEDNSARNAETETVTTLSARPSWSHEFTELDSLSLSAGYLNRTFGGGDSNGNIDYSFYDMSAGWQHQFTETDAFTAGSSYGHYDPQGAGTDRADLVNASLGWSHRFSEILQVRLSGGPSFRWSGGLSSGGNTDAGYNAGVGVTYQPSDLTKVLINFTHQNEPTSNGALQVRDRVGLTVSYQLDETTTLSMSGTYIENESGQGRSSNDFDRYFSVEPRLTWQLEEDLDLGLSYRFQEKTFSDPSDQAMSNAVFLRLTYRAPRQSWSD